MRKFAVSGIMLGAAMGLALPLGGGVQAEDSNGLFPPDMLQAAPVNIAVVASAPKLTSGPAATVVAAPAAEPLVLASSAVPRRLAGVDAKHREDATASTRRHVAPLRLAALHHKRHVRHARHIPIVTYPVQTARVPLPPLRLADTRSVTAASSCVGFCGKYVLVGVGF